MADYYFFLSYAAEADGPQLRQFFSDLAREISVLAPWPEAAAGFIDQRQQRGSEWDQNLTNALATTKVLVALYSPIYFTKEYCGREIDIMLQRRRRYREQHPAAIPTNIVPVIWDPFERPHTPINHVARTLPKFFVNRDRDSVYEREGLRFMIESGAHQPAYVAARRQIAKDIIAAATSFRLPALNPPPSIHATSNAFIPRRAPLDPAALGAGALGPRSAVAVYVGPAGWESADEGPFRPPDQDAAGYVAAAIAQSAESELREVRVVPDAAEESLPVLDRLAEGNARVLVIVDGRSLATPLVRAWLSRFDARQLSNCATIVVGDAARPAVEALLPKSAARANTLLHTASTADALAHAVTTSLHLLHDYISSNGEAKAVIERRTDHTSLPSLVLSAA